MSKEQVSYNYSTSEVLKQEMDLHDLTLESIDKELPDAEAKSLAFTKLIAAVEYDLYEKVKRVNKLVDEIKAFHEARLAGTGTTEELNAVLTTYNTSLPLFPPLSPTNRATYDPNSSSNARNYLNDTLDKAAWFSNIGFDKSITGFTQTQTKNSSGIYEPEYSENLSYAFRIVEECNIELNEEDHWDGTYELKYVERKPGSYKASAGGGPTLQNVPRLVCPLEHIPDGAGVITINKINIKIYGYDLKGENPVEVKESDLNEDTVGIGTFNVLQNIKNTYDVGINTNNSVNFTYDGQTFSGNITEGSTNYNNYLKPKFDEIASLRSEINDLMPDINKMKDMRKKSDLYTWSLKFSKGDTKKEKEKKKDTIGTFDKFQEKYKDILGFPEPENNEIITRAKTFKELTEKEKRELSEFYGLGIPKNTKPKLDQNNKPVKDPETGEKLYFTDDGFNQNYDEKKLKKFVKKNPELLITADLTVTESGSIIVIDSVGTATTFTGISTQINRVTSGAMNDDNVGTGASITSLDETTVGYSTADVLPSPASEVGLAVTYSGSIGIATLAWQEGYFDEVIANTFTGAATSIRAASIDNSLNENLPLLITVGASTDTRADITPVVNSDLTYNPSTGELRVGLISATQITGVVGASTQTNVNDGNSNTDGVLLFTNAIANNQDVFGDSGIRVNPSNNEIIAGRFTGIVSATDVTISGVSTFTGAIDANGDLDVDGHTELDNVNVSGVSTFVGNADFNGDIDVDGHTELDNVNVSGVSTFVGTADFNGDIDVSGDIDFNGNVLISSKASSNNIDHIWHDDATSFGKGGTWNFVSDGTKKATGNSAIQIGYLKSSGGGHFLNSVGIGTTNPQEKLHVSGTSDFVVDTDSSALRFGSYGEYDIALVTGRNTEDGSSRLYIENGNGEALRITADGKVGINKSSPERTLDITSDATAGIIQITGARTFTGNNAFFSGRSSRGTIDSPATLVADDIITTFSGLAHDGSNYLPAGRLRFGVDSISTGNVNSNLQFIVSNNGEYEAMHITSDGKVGIKSTAPETGLDVRSDDGIFIKSASNGPTNGARIQFSDQTSATQRGHIIYKHPDNSISPGSNDGFLIGGTENLTVVKVEGRAIIDEKVGIGTDNPTSPLTVKEVNNVAIELLKTTNASILTLGEDGNSGGNINAPNGALLLSQGGTERLRITSDGKVRVPDNGKFVAGDGDDLEIYHDGTHSRISDEGSGSLLIQTNGTNIQLNKGTSENMLVAIPDGAVELYHNNNKKLETGQYGVTVTGSLAASNIDLADNAKLLIGTGDDLEIYHDGSNSYIKDTGTGRLLLNTSGFRVNSAQNTESMIHAEVNGAVKLYYDNSKKFETTGVGVSVLNGSSNTATIAGPSNLIIDPGVVGDNTGIVQIKGDLVVDGTTTTINSDILDISNFVIGIASTATTDALADGSGFEFGPGDNSFKYFFNSGTNPSLKSSENLNVASGKGYQVNQVEVLNATTLGSSVVNSSLTNLGTLTALTVSGSANFTSTTTPITTNAIKFNNTENDGNYYTDAVGTLVFDENFHSDTAYGSGTYAPKNVFTGGNGGGLLIKNEDGWGAVFTTKNTRWASAEWDGLTVGGNRVLTVADEGSGNGLDADTLDGTHASAFALKSGTTFTGNVTIEDSELKVGDVSGDNYVLIKQAQSDAYGFDWQHNNASVLINEQGNTNQALVLGDVDANNSYGGLFGISHTSDNGSNWTKKLDLRGNGDLYIGSSAQNRVLTTADEGSGNGLDADLLDGIQATGFLRKDTDDSAQGFGHRANLNSTGDSGLLILNGSRLGFDQTGTRSWTFKASGGNLNITSGDGNGTLTGQINASTLDSIDSSQFLRSDADDTFTGTITGATLHLGGSQISSSSAKLQVNGFMRTGSVYIHEGGSSPNTNSKELSNVSGELYWENKEVWNAGNDGTGSGLDADLLDGQHGSYYLDTSSTAQTKTGNLTISKTSPKLILNDTNENSGSYAGVQFDTNNNQGVLLEHNEFDSELPTAGYGLVLKESPNNTQFPTTGTLSLCVLGEIYAGNTSLGSLSRVLTTADEGSGNGLDADTLDGQQGSYYLNTSATTQTKSGGLNIIGNIGIGTDNPLQKLHLVDDTSANIYLETKNSSTGSTSGIYFRTSHSSTQDAFFKTAIVLEDDGTSFARGKLHILQNNTADDSNATLSNSVVTIDQSGKVGIGTDNPQAFLHLETPAATGGWQIRTDSYGLNNESGFYRDASDHYECVLRNGAGGLAFIKNNGGASNPNLHFHVGTTEKMRITSDGDVGIGTDNPGSLLTLDHATNPAILFRDSGTKVASINAEGTQTNIASFEGKDLVFAASSSSAFTERLRITTDGTIQLSNLASTYTSGTATRFSLYNDTNNHYGLHVGGSFDLNYNAGGSVLSGKGEHRFHTAAQERLRITKEGKVRVPDNGKFVAGTGDDLQIFHDGSNNYILASNGDIVLKNSSSDYFRAFSSTGAVQINYNGNKKFETTTFGIDVTGHTETDTLNVSGIATVLTGNITTINSVTINNTGHLDSEFIDVGIVTANTGIVTSGYIEHLSVEEQIFTTDGNTDVDNTFDEITISFDAQGRSLINSEKVLYIAGSPGIGGLTDGQVYYVQSVGINTIKLYTDSGLVNLVNISPSGSDGLHTFRKTEVGIGTIEKFYSTSSVIKDINVTGVATVGFATITDAYIGVVTTTSITIGSAGSTYLMPTTDGNQHQVLSTNGSGTVSFIDPDKFGGNRIYVSSILGNDSNDGKTAPVKTIKKAAQLAAAESFVYPVTIMVAGGDYAEDNPIILADDVAVVGDNLRRVIVRPQNRLRDCFRVRNGNYITGIVFKDNIEFPTGAGVRHDILDQAGTYAKALVNQETGTVTNYRNITPITNSVVSSASTLGITNRINELITLTKDSITNESTIVPTESDGNSDQEFTDAATLIISNVGASVGVASTAYIPGNSVGWSTSASGGNYTLSDSEIADFEEDVHNIMLGIADDLRYGGTSGNEYTLQKIRNIVVGTPSKAFDFIISFDDPLDTTTSRDGYVGLSSDKPRITQSPYIQNCSIISFLGANGANVDGSKIIQENEPIVGQEAENPFVGDIPDQGKSMVANAFTAVSFGGIGWKVSNAGYAQIVSCFQIFCSIGSYAQSGGYLSITNSATNFGLYALRSTGFRAQAFDFDKGFIFSDGTSGVNQTLRVGGLQRDEQDLYVLRFINLTNGLDQTSNFKQPGITTSLSSSGINTITDTINITGVTNSLADADGLLYIAPSNENQIGGLINDTVYYIDKVGAGTSANLYFDDELRNKVDLIDVPAGIHTFTKVAEEFFVSEIIEKNNIYQNLTLSDSIGIGVTFVPGTSITQTRSDDAIAVGFAVTWTSTVLTVSIENSVNSSGGTERLLFQTTTTASGGSGNGKITDENGTETSVNSVASRSDLHTINFKVDSTISGNSIQSIASLPKSYKCHLHRPSIVNSSAHTWEYAGSGIDYNALPQNGGTANADLEQYNENGGRVFSSGTNELGDFKIGDSITAFNRTGNIEFKNKVTIGQLDSLELSLSGGIKITEISASKQLGENELGGPLDSRLSTQAAIRGYLVNRLGSFIDQNKSTSAIPSAVPQLNSQGLLDPGMIPAQIRFNNVFDTNVSGGRTDLVNDIPAIEVLKSDIVSESYSGLTNNYTLTFENESQFLVLSSDTQNYAFNNGDEIIASQNNAVGIVTIPTHPSYGSTGLVQGVINSITLTNGGSGYGAAGIYSGVNLVSLTGSGTSATADVTVDALGEVESVNIRKGGRYYASGDTFRVDASDIGNNSGTEFTATVDNVDTRLYVKLTGEKQQFFASTNVPDFISDGTVASASTDFSTVYTETILPTSIGVGGSIFFPENSILINPNTLDFNTGDPVLYTVSGGVVIGQLENNKTYFVKRVGVSSIQLCESYDGTTIVPLDSSGTGTHQLKRLGVSTSTDFIVFKDHGFTTGQSVKYTTNDGPSGIATGSYYFVGSVTTNGFTLHDVRQDALNSISGSTVNARDLTTVGSGIGTFDVQNVTFTNTINTSSNNINNFSILVSSSDIDASNIISGVINTNRLASTGTPSNTTFLRGDQKWETAVQKISVGVGTTSALIVTGLTPSGEIAGTGINTYFGNLRLDVQGITTAGVGVDQYSKIGVVKLRWKQGNDVGPFKVTNSGHLVDLETTSAGSNNNGIDAYSFQGQSLASVVDLSNSSVNGNPRNVLPSTNGGTGLNNSSGSNQGKVLFCDTINNGVAVFGASANPTIDGTLGVGYFDSNASNTKGTLDINKVASHDTSTTTTTATTQTSIFSFDKSTFRTGKFIISVTDNNSNEYHSTEMLVIHNGTDAFKTEYASIFTTQLATFAVDVSGSNVRVLATPASTNSTTFNVYASGLIRV